MQKFKHLAVNGPQAWTHSIHMHARVHSHSHRSVAATADRPRAPTRSLIDPPFSLLFVDRLKWFEKKKKKERKKEKENPYGKICL